MRPTMVLMVSALVGRSAARRAAIDRIGFAAGRDLLGLFGGLHQQALQLLDLFQRQGVGFELQTFDPFRRRFGRAHQVVNSGFDAYQPQIGLGFAAGLLGHGIIPPAQAELSG